MCAHRPGLTAVELVIVVLIASILVRFAVPEFQRFANRAQVTAVLADIQTVRAAAAAYHAETDRWPRDVDAGVVPPELVPYLPAGFTFVRDVYVLDWDHWVLPDGSPGGSGMGILVGISLVTEEAWLGEALMAFVGRDMATYTIGDHYTFIIAGV